jgi:hypothetical protein
VKLYGIKPIRLLNKIKVNNTEINGKYFSPSIFKLSKTNCAAVSYTVSKKVCHTFGIKKKEFSFKYVVSELIKKIVVLKINNTRILINNIFVNEKSKQNNLIEKIEII